MLTLKITNKKHQYPSKVYVANVKVFADKQMDGRTNRRAKNYMPPIYRCGGSSMFMPGVAQFMRMLASASVSRLRLSRVCVRLRLSRVCVRLRLLASASVSRLCASASVSRLCASASARVCVRLRLCASARVCVRLRLLASVSRLRMLASVSRLSVCVCSRLCASVCVCVCSRLCASAQALPGFARVCLRLYASARVCVRLFTSKVSNARVCLRRSSCLASVCVYVRLPTSVVLSRVGRLVSRLCASVCVCMRLLVNACGNWLILCVCLRRSSCLASFKEFKGGGTGSFHSNAQVLLSYNSTVSRHTIPLLYLIMPQC